LVLQTEALLKAGYGPTFDSAMRALFGGEASSLSGTTAPAEPEQGAAAPAAATKSRSDVNALITGAAKDLADYQRLTAEGKLGESGKKLEQLARKLDELNAHQK
jgi:uncharacterized protein